MVSRTHYSCYHKIIHVYWILFSRILDITLNPKVHPLNLNGSCTVQIKYIIFSVDYTNNLKMIKTLISFIAFIHDSDKFHKFWRSQSQPGPSTVAVRPTQYFSLISSSPI